MPSPAGVRHRRGVRPERRRERAHRPAPSPTSTASTSTAPPPTSSRAWCWRSRRRSPASSTWAATRAAPTTRPGRSPRRWRSPPSARRPPRHPALEVQQAAPQPGQRRSTVHARRAEGDDQQAATELVRMVRAEGEACRRPPASTWPRSTSSARRADLLAIRPIEGAAQRQLVVAEPGPGHGQHRERLPERRDRAARRQHGVPTPANALMQRLAPRSRRRAASGCAPCGRRAARLRGEG